MDLNVVVMLWVVCAIAGGFAAQWRGGSRTQTEGFVLGLLLGPIGLLLILLWPGKPEVSQPDQTSR
jgi:hypothetical protein